MNEVEEPAVIGPQRTFRIRLGGTTLVCHSYGRGPVCVAHPGGPGISWEYLRMPLVEREMTVVYVEPAGTGDSSPLGENTHVERLEAVVEALAGAPVFLLGHGHGGSVAQSYALRRPDRVAGLILYATSPLVDARTAADRRQRLREHAEETVVAAYDRPAGPDDEAATRRLREIFPAFFADYRRRQAEFVHLRQELRCWPAHESDFDLRSALPSITVPTMIITGAHDVIVGPEPAPMLHSGIAGSQLTVFHDSGHLPHLEEAERFAHLVIEFTRRHFGAARTVPSPPRWSEPAEMPLDDHCIGT